MSRDVVDNFMEYIEKKGSTNGITCTIEREKIFDGKYYICVEFIDGNGNRDVKFYNREQWVAFIRAYEQYRG